MYSLWYRIRYTDVYEMKMRPLIGLVRVVVLLYIQSLYYAVNTKLLNVHLVMEKK